MSFYASNTVLLYISFCFTSSMYTLIPKLQDKHYTPNNPRHTYYHPLMQTELMILGEMLCLVIFYLQGGRKQLRDDDRPRAPLWVCSIPLMLDLTSTTLEFIALNYLSGSMYNITSSIVIVSSAFFTRIILKRTFSKIQILGCMLVIIGVVITGFGEQMDDSISSQEQQVMIGIFQNEFYLGIILTVTAYIIEGLQMVVAQIIMTKYSMTPLQYVGTCGAIGAVIWTCVLTVLTFLGCPLAEKQCVQDYGGNYHMQHFPTFFSDIRGSTFLILMTISFILINIWYNFDLNTIIKLKSAMVYQMVSSLSNGVVWAIGIIITILGGSDKQFHIESLNFNVLMVKMIGFAVSTFGLLIYEQQFVKKEEQEPLVQFEPQKSLE